MTIWHEPEQKNPQKIAFILSSPRSGSTLLRVMLAGHPALYSPPELHLLPFETMGDRQAELGLSHLGEGLQRALMDLDKLTPEESLAKVTQWVADNRSIAEIYAYLQTKAAGRLLIDKSPSYGSDRHILDHSEILFDNAKYIHLVRHPYAVIESFARLRMDKLLGAQSSDPYGLAESIWAQSNRNILALGNQVSRDQYLQIVYEDLVRNPRATMAQICEFLGVDLDESVLNPYGGDRLTDGLHQQSMGVGDPNFLQHKTIDANLAEKWREIELPHRLQTSTIHLAETLQYELPHDDPATTDVEYPMTESIVQVRGINYCLCEWGDPENPLVLLLHGILEQGASWQLIAPQIAAQGYRVVAPDLRGHGKSDHAQSYSMLDFLADVDALAKSLTDKPFTLVGHSMGSVIGAMYAGIRQAQVTQLFLVETIVPNDINDAETANHLTTHLDYLAAPPQHPVFPDVAIAARRLRQVTPQLSEELSAALVERSTVAVENGVQWRWDAFLRTRAGIEFNGISRRRYLALLADIQAQITLVYGDASEFNRPEDLEAIRTAMPNAERLTVAGGHNLHFENPQAIADILIQHLNSPKMIG
jgi:pimeloyl-ACP methyl ester carboxylesterase